MERRSGRQKQRRPRERRGWWRAAFLLLDVFGLIAEDGSGCCRGFLEVFGLKVA